MANRIELYNKTVDILYQAYFNDTLEHGNCCACAVGNIIAANMGKTFERVFDTVASTRPRERWAWVGEKYPGEISRDFPDLRVERGWGSVFYTNDEGRQRFYIGKYFGKAAEQIDSTGYQVKELARIEKAFETVGGSQSPEDRMFDGLVAVLETLKKIHEIDDNEDIIQKFSQHRKDKEAVCVA